MDIFGQAGAVPIYHNNEFYIRWKEKSHTRKAETISPHDTEVRNLGRNLGKFGHILGIFWGYFAIFWHI